MSPPSAVMSQSLHRPLPSGIWGRGCKGSSVGAIEPQKEINKKRQRQRQEVNKYTDARVGEFKRLRADKSLEDQSACIGIANLSDGSSGISEEHAPPVAENNYGTGSSKRCKLDAPTPSIVWSGSSFRIRIPAKLRATPVGQEAKCLSSTASGAGAANDSHVRQTIFSCAEAKLTKGTANAELITGNRGAMLKTIDNAKFKTGVNDIMLKTETIGKAKLKDGTTNDAKLKPDVKLNAGTTNDPKLKAGTTIDLKLKVETTCNPKLKVGTTNDPKLRSGITNQAKLKELTANAAKLERTDKLKVQTAHSVVVKARAANDVGAKAQTANGAGSKAQTANGAKLEAETAKADPKLKTGTANDPKFKAGTANDAKFKMGTTNDSNLKPKTTLGAESKSGTTHCVKLKTGTTHVAELKSGTTDDAKLKAGTMNCGKLQAESSNPEQWVGRSDSLTEQQKVELSDEALYKALTQDWSVPLITAERENSDDQDWLFGVKQRKETVPVRLIPEAAADASWPYKKGLYCNRARFIPEADVFALPYTILF